MIADLGAPGNERWRPHRLLGILRGVFASLLSPALAIVEGSLIPSNSDA